METVRPRVSFADLQRMPDDHRRYELYDGELRVVPSPLPIHQRVVVRLLEAFLDFARRTGGEAFTAPFDIVLTNFDVVQPDLIYFGPEAAGRIKLREHVRFRPDVAVEVLSPSTVYIDRGRKRDLFARHGLPEYWLVDPDASRIEVWVFDGGRLQRQQVVESGDLGSPTQPGLRVNVDELFRGLE